MNKKKNLHKIISSIVLVLIIASLFVPAAIAAPPGPTIVDVALAVNSETGEFSILIAALLAADPAVLQTLDGNGQFTVFVPTDSAYISLLSELGLSVEDLLSDQEFITEVLPYHVARGRRYSSAVLGSERIRTYQRSFLMQDSGVLTDANGRTSNIIAVDIEAANGIIHVIDTVVVP